MVNLTSENFALFGHCEIAYTETSEFDHSLVEVTAMVNSDHLVLLNGLFKNNNYFKKKKF